MRARPCQPSWSSPSSSGSCRSGSTRQSGDSGRLLRSSRRAARLRRPTRRTDVSAQTPSDRPTDALPTSWQRLLALSGVAFAVLFILAWFLSGGNAPDYTAPDQDWTTWADDNQWKSRIGGFLILLAGFVFLHFAATIRSMLGSAEATQ